MTLQAVKGTHDILPDDVEVWQHIERQAQSLFDRFGYREIRTPLFEATEAFARAIGTETDIVSKEMYTFTDRGGESLTLRPEATAGIVRAVIEHNLVQHDPLLKLYLIGPMFRAEQPQKGRYRQFHQVDVEAFGMNEAQIDAEIIQMALEYLDRCGLTDYRLLLNSVGDAQCRPNYVDTLRSELRKCAHFLCADCRRRSEVNPLRVLDCKVPQDQAIINDLPKIVDHLCNPCRDHYGQVKQELNELGIKYSQDNRLVRGLDYYVRTTFEVVSGQLGASQNAVLGGGRYDGLVKQLGGPDLSGIGFALGMERLVMLLSQQQQSQQAVAPATKTKRCDVYIAPLLNDSTVKKLVLKLQKDLRDQGHSVLRATEARGLKAQLKRADRLGAAWVAVLGENELNNKHWLIRDMTSSDQEDVAFDKALNYFNERLGKKA